MKIKFDYDSVLTTVFIIYWCATPIVSVCSVFVGKRFAGGIVDLLILILLMIYCCHNRPRHHGKVLLLYAFVVLIIISTIIVHPEYISWYTHDYYGIKQQFLTIRGAIWAYAIVGLYTDKERLKKDLSIVTIIIFLLYFGRFVVAMHQGYWVTANIYGEKSYTTYDMGFGYRILFVASFWGAKGMIESKKYLILYFLCLILILMGGSRGSAICALALFVLVIPYKYENLSVKLKCLFIFSGIILIPIIFLFVININTIMLSLGNILKDLGLSSRTTSALADGSMFDGNGRTVIYEMAINLIKNGGAFGHGFYGDRAYIGQRFIWGYSHNIFLELLVTFGWLGGTIIIILLCIGLITMYKNIKDKTSQIIVITFMVSSLKLLMSSSFWYEPSFWSLLAVMILLNKSPENDNVTRINSCPLKFINNENNYE